MGELRSAVFHVSRFDSVARSGELPTPGSFDELPGASDAAARVRGALTGLGYTVSGDAELRSKELGRRVFDFIEEGKPDDVQIVHISSHGEPADASHELYIIGSDGERHREAGVEAWVREIEDHADKRAVTLFVVDACYAGRASELSWQVARSTTDRLPRAIVLAATRWDKRAYEFYLSRALAEVLGSPKEHLDILRTERYLPWETVRDCVDDVMIRLDDGATGQRPRWTPIGQRLLPEDFPFFPNPDYEPPTPLESVKAAAPAGLVALMDAVDVGHFTGRATNDRVQDGTGVGLFRGRHRELESLSAWLDTPASEDSVRVVTGSPGAGKSALLGMLVCAGIQPLRETTRQVWEHVPHQARPLVAAAAVHARNLQVEDVSSTIARQLDLLSQDRKAMAPSDLVTAIRTMGQQPTIILDALDEAADVGSLVSVLLLTLVHARRRDGTRACRILVGTRSGYPWTEIAPLLEAIDRDQILDLDRADPAILTADLHDFVHDALGLDPRWARARPATRAKIAHDIARALVESTTTVDLGRAANWGAFLVASLYVDYLRREIEPTDDTAVASASRHVPTTLPAVLELDLASDIKGSRRRTLTAIALGHGDGIPARIAAIIDSALSPPSDVAPEPRDWQSAIDDVRFYLRSTGDADGTNLYRVFHQGLTDYLTSTLNPEDSSRVLEAIISDRTTKDEYRHWVTAGRYLARHALDHAADAGRAVELLEDTELLVAASPHAVRAALHETARQPRDIAAVYSASPLDVADPARRRDVLSLNARRFRLDDVADKLLSHPDRPSRFAPRWSTGSQTSQALIDTLTGHTSTVAAVACTTLDGRPTAVTASHDDRVRIWDLTTGQPIGEPLTGHTNTVYAVACTTLGGHPAAVTGGWDRTVRIWDLTTAQPTGKPLTGHTNTVTAVACTTINGQPTAVTGSKDRTIRIWNLTTGQPTGKPLTGDTGDVTAVACTTINGQPTAVTGDNAGIVRIWDLTTGQPTGKPLTGHTSDVTAVACTTINGQPTAVTGSKDRTIRIWNLAKGESVGSPLTGHTNIVAAVACSTIGGRPIAVTGSRDATVRIWELAMGRPLGEPATGHTGDVYAGAGTTLNGLPAAVTASHDHTVRVWDLTTGGPIGKPLAGHTDGVYTVACTTLDGRPIAVTGSNDRTIRIWDLTTGQPTGRPLTGHTDSVTAAACATLDGRPVAVTASHDHTVRIWDLTTGQPTGKPLTGHTDSVYTVACTTLDGHPIAVTGSLDRRVGVWDITTGRNMATFQTVDQVRAVVPRSLPEGPLGILIGFGHEVALLSWEPE
ncbi:caspase family protein [Microbacterium thalassium]|uniref:caspase family protein n=1 Tax=Microbacterium thalassium TaxID=362649 RepID=UPI0031E410A2